MAATTRRRGRTSPPLHAHIEDGAIVYSFPNKAAFAVNDSVDVFLGDHLVGTADIDPDKLVAQVSLKQLPPAEFPARLRGLLRSTNTELPTTVIEGFADLLKSIATPEIKARISEVDQRSLGIEAEIADFPEYRREFALIVNGQQVGTSASEVPIYVGRPATLNHKISFSLPILLRDGDLVAVVDTVSGRTILTVPITWINLVGPVMNALETLRGEYQKATEELDQFRSRLDSFANITSESAIFDRLDLYYHLLSERLDRSLRLVYERIGSDSPEPAPPPPDGIRTVGPPQLEGIGFYQVEAGEGGEWRWFGPRVTLLFREVPSSASLVRLSFDRMAPGVEPGKIRATIDGIEVAAGIRSGAEGDCEIALPIDRRAWRPDGTVIVQLAFASAHVPENDSRAMTAVFTGAELV